MTSRRLALLVTLWSGTAVAAVSSSCVGDDANFTPAPSSDAGPIEASTDTGAPYVDAAVEAAAPTFCKAGKAHDFCTDFDGFGKLKDDGYAVSANGTLTNLAWTVEETAGSGVAAVRMTVPGAPSAPSAMLVKLERMDAGSYGAARFSLQGQYAPAPTRAATLVKFEMRIDRADGVGRGAYFVGLESAGLRFFLVAPDSGAALELWSDQGVTGGQNFTGLTVPFRVWTHVEVTITPRNEAGGGATIEVPDGSRIFAISTPDAGLPLTFRTDVGLGTGSGGGSWTVLYDNVTIDWK